MKLVAKVALGGVAALAAAQLITFDRTNPPVTGDVEAPPEVKNVLRRACYDCHSNETAWPWYSRVAPMSWLVHDDVAEGRAHLNFSEWNRLSPAERAKKQRKVGHEVSEGEMPLWFYTPLHPAARLGAAERQLLQAWAGSGAAGGPRGPDDDD